MKTIAVKRDGQQRRDDVKLITASPRTKSLARLYNDSMQMSAPRAELIAIERSTV